MPVLTDAEPCPARDVDDPTAPGLLHCRRDRLGGPECSRLVHRDDRLPLFDGHLFEGLPDLPEHATGVVHEHVDATGARPCRLDPCLDLDPVRDVYLRHVTVLTQEL